MMSNRGNSGESGNSGSGNDSLIKHLLKRHAARGLAGRRPLIMEKPMFEITRDVREKLLKLGHPTYKSIWNFAGKPKGEMSVSMFQGILGKLGVRTTEADAKLILCSLCSGKTNVSFVQFCQHIAQDKTKTWDEIREIKTEREKFTLTMDGGTKRLRPDLRNKVLESQKNLAAGHFYKQTIHTRGVEAFAFGRLVEKSPKRILMSKLVRRTFNPRFKPYETGLENGEVVTHDGRRICRASNFVKGLRTIGIQLPDNEIRKLVSKYTIRLNINDTPTKMVDLERFLEVGEAKADAESSPSMKIVRGATKNRVVGLPNRGIDDDTGIRRIATPELKSLILKKIDQRSRPGGGICLEAFKMFAPGVRGSITPRYFQKRLADHGLILQKCRSDKLLREVDHDNSGEISFTEFANHFVPHGIESGSLTDKLAAGASKTTGKLSNKPQTRLNVTLPREDRELAQQKWGLRDSISRSKLTVEQKSPNVTSILDGDEPSSVFGSAESVHDMPTFRSSSFNLHYDSPQSTHRGEKKVSVSRLLTGSRSSPTLRNAALHKFAGRLSDSKRVEEENMPWWAQNRQPSRLNWKRLGVERASGTITGAYSKCCLPRGAEVYF